MLKNARDDLCFSRQPKTAAFWKTGKKLHFYIPLQEWPNAVYEAGAKVESGDVSFQDLSYSSLQLQWYSHNYLNVELFVFSDVFSNDPMI